MTNFIDEREFDTFFYGLKDPKREVKELAKWRQFQMRVVSKFIQQIRLIANDQYTNLDHFLLELLQNADDNAYPDGVEKTFKLTLTEDSVIIENNEAGFSAGNLYAITYSGASTKTRTKTSRTYIGEKGIGFKSVFAVAEYVDIHSPPYHFRLQNDEYIVPHPLPAEPVTGTRIVIRLKPSGQGIREILASRIESLARGAQEFTLFLQQLERLELADRVRGNKSTVLSARDDANGYYVIEHDGKTSEYVKVGYERTIPLEVAKTRFDEIDQGIVRELTFAVPMPAEDGSEPVDRGMLFCFLPTGVRTGLPIHIQADAKTITNRENIQSFATSDWNRALFVDFETDMCQLYVDLNVYSELRDHLPAYWPVGTNDKNLGNRDLEALLVKVEESLGGYPIFLDRHGEFRWRDEVRMVPHELAPYLGEDRYEQAVTYFAVGYYPDPEMDSDEAESWAEEVADNRITFIASVWQTKYSDRLNRLGVEYLDIQEVVAALDDGAPVSLDVEDDGSVRAFLSAIMDYAENQRRFDAKTLPIFPVVEKGRRTFAAIDDTTMWLQTDSARVSSNTETRVIDPAFTYSPGGGQQRDGGEDDVRAFNQRFRKFLSEYLRVPSYSEEELLRRSLIPELVRLELDIAKRDQRERVIDLWRQLFTKIWRRQKTILKDSGEEKLNKIFKELASCRILTREAGTTEWGLTPVTFAFLSKRFRTTHNLEHGYAGAGAPIIDLGMMDSSAKKKKGKKKPKVDWEEWRDFLLRCGANDGPYLVREDLTAFVGRRFSTRLVEGEKASTFEQRLRGGLRQNWELMRSGEGSVTLRDGSKTTSLDEFTRRLLDEHRRVPGGLERLNELYESASGDRTVINFIWGYKYNDRQVTVNYVVALDQLSKGVSLPSNKGEVSSTSCFLRTAENERILGSIAPIIDAPGVSTEFLAYIGVRDRVTVENLAELIADWFEDSKAQFRKTDDFLPFLDAVSTYALLYTEDVHKLVLKIKLYDPQSDSLICAEDWLAIATSTGFSDQVVTRLGQALQCEQQRTPAQILESLFALDDLAADSDVAVRLLIDLGNHISAGEDGLGEAFKSQLSAIGLKVRGHSIKSVRELPPIWDRLPCPIDGRQFLVLRSSTRSRKYLRTALYELDWTYLGEEVPMCIDAPGAVELDEVNARRVHLAVSELRDDLRESRPAIARKIDGFQLFDDASEVRQRVMLSESLGVVAEVDGREFRCEVPYWFGDGRLIIQQDVELWRALPRFLDDHAGTTITGVFRYLWDAKEQESRVFIPAGNVEPPIRPPEYPGGGHKGGGGASGEPPDHKSDLDDNIFEDTESTDEGGEDEEPGTDSESGDSTDPKNTPRRKRLQTVVQVTPTTTTGGSSDGDALHNKQVEDAGRSRFLAYLEGQGAVVVSREADNVGYDFEVTVGAEVFYVELKSSQDKWEGWEHALSANEFKTALKLGDKYFLCAVDYAYNDNDYQLYFIRDPANHVANFAFDSPWKALAISMNAFLSRMKDKHGMVV